MCRIVAASGGLPIPLLVISISPKRWFRRCEGSGAGGGVGRQAMKDAANERLRPIRVATPRANSPSQALELDPSAEGPVKLPAPFRAARGPQFPVRSVTDDMSARRVNWVEVLSTLLLALAAVSTAWASYQASR